MKVGTEGRGDWWSGGKWGQRVKSWIPRLRLLLRRSRCCCWVAKRDPELEGTHEGQGCCQSFVTRSGGDCWRSASSPRRVWRPLRGRSSCPEKLRLNAAGRREAGGGREPQQLTCSWHQHSEVELRTSPGPQARSLAGARVHPSCRHPAPPGEARQWRGDDSHPSEVTKSILPGKKKQREKK